MPQTESPISGSDAIPTTLLLPTNSPSTEDETPSLHPDTAGPSIVTPPSTNRDICQSIEQQELPTDLVGEDPTTFGMTMDVQYFMVTSNSVVSYLESINIPVTLWIAGCEEEAMQYLAADSKRRKLQEQETSGVVQYSHMEPWTVDGEFVFEASMGPSRYLFCVVPVSSQSISIFDE